MKSNIQFSALIASVFAFALAHPAPAASAPGTTASAQAEAVRKYPELGKAGSAFNLEFVARVKRYQAEKPDFFKDPVWPMRLADEVAQPAAKPATGIGTAAPTPAISIKRPPFQKASSKAPSEPFCSVDIGKDGNIPGLLMSKNVVFKNGSLQCNGIYY